jgi:3-oxoacyl-[acyl-carrier protein] reductase
MKDRIVLVTGAGRGIGRAIAEAFAGQGACVAVTARSGTELDHVALEGRKRGGTLLSIVDDLADAAAPARVFGAVTKAFGRLDILVNNAGVFVTGQVHDRANNLAELDRLFAVNVGGVAAAVRAAAPLMGEGGRIISIGSVVGDATPWPGASDYSASKGAVAAYTRGWARDLGPKGITVNNVQPGPIDTDMNPAANGEFANLQNTKTALGRYGKPEEVAAAVAFLASPSAAYITGATLNVDGGFNA